MLVVSFFGFDLLTLVPGTQGDTYDGASKVQSASSQLRIRLATVFCLPS